MHDESRRRIEHEREVEAIIEKANHLDDVVPEKLAGQVVRAKRKIKIMEQKKVNVCNV